MESRQLFALTLPIRSPNRGVKTIFLWSFLWSFLWGLTR